MIEKNWFKRIAKAAAVFGPLAAASPEVAHAKVPEPTEMQDRDSTRHVQEELYKRFKMYKELRSGTDINAAADAKADAQKGKTVETIEEQQRLITLFQEKYNELHVFREGVLKGVPFGVDIDTLSTEILTQFLEDEQLGTTEEKKEREQARMVALKLLGEIERDKEEIDMALVAKRYDSIGPRLKRAKEALDTFLALPAAVSKGAVIEKEYYERLPKDLKKNFPFPPFIPAVPFEKE